MPKLNMFLFVAISLLYGIVHHFICFKWSSIYLVFIDDAMTGAIPDREPCTSSGCWNYLFCAQTLKIISPISQVRPVLVY